MAKKQNPVLRYTEAILSKPHLISADSFNVIRGYLEDRNAGKLMRIDDIVDEDEKDEEPDDLDDFDPESGIGVIQIKGSLTNEPLMTMCGAIGTSYEGILEQTEDMIEAGVKTIILEISSGGGEAFNCFQASDRFRAMCDEADVDVYAYVGNCAASAAYAWAVVADEVVAHPDATVGSIGALIALINDSKALEKEGIVRSFVVAGKEKVPFAEDGSFRPEFMDDLQYKVDLLYENFVAHVSKYTGLSSKEIKDTEAKTFMAADALNLGMVNNIMTEYEFTNYIVNKGASNA